MSTYSKKLFSVATASKLRGGAVTLHTDTTVLTADGRSDTIFHSVEDGEGITVEDNVTGDCVEYVVNDFEYFGVCDQTDIKTYLLVPTAESKIKFPSCANTTVAIAVRD